MANPPVMKKRPIPAAARRPAPGKMVRRPAPIMRRKLDLRPLHPRHKRVRGHLAALLLRGSVGADLGYGWDGIGAPPGDPYYGLGIRGAFDYLQALKWMEGNTTDDRSDPDIAMKLVGARMSAVQAWDLILASMGLAALGPPYTALPTTQYDLPSTEWDAFLRQRYPPASIWPNIVKATADMKNNPELISATAPVGPSPGPGTVPSAPETTAPAAPAAEKSNLVWWLLVAAVVGGGGYLLLSSGRKRR